MPKYYPIPFATAGDKAAIPDDYQPSGSVNYESGYGPDYELVLGVDPAAKPFPRDQNNQMMFDITENIQQYQQNGTPEFITTSDNGGSPFPYSKNARVRYDNGSGYEVYTSLVDNNTSLPPDATKWSKGSTLNDSVYLYNVTFGSSVASGLFVAFSSATNKFELAVANGTYLQNVVGIADVANSRILVLGLHPEPVTPGAIYWLTTDALAPGGFTSVEPANLYDNILLGYGLSSSELFLSPQVVPSSRVPYCKVYLNTNFAPVPASSTVIPFASVLTGYDPYGMFISASHEIKILKAGTYRISGTLNANVSSIQPGNFSQLNLHVNGALIQTLSSKNFTNTGVSVVDPPEVSLTGGTLLKLNVNDLVQLEFRSTGATSYLVNGGATNNDFSLEYIGS